jgi:hypothetical protein
VVQQVISNDFIMYVLQLDPHFHGGISKELG